jgi:hypothetical protein
LIDKLDYGLWALARGWRAQRWARIFPAAPKYATLFAAGVPAHDIEGIEPRRRFPETWRAGRNKTQAVHAIEIVIQLWRSNRHSSGNRRA